MPNTHNIIATFPVLHPNFYPDKNFYEVFEPWRKKQLEKGHPTTGIYKLKAGHPISRLLGRDHEGILYIGKGIILNAAHRLGKLVNSLNQTEFLHDAGNRYNYGKIPHRFPLTDLSVEVELCTNAEEREHQELEAYLHKFGELPPLNRQS